MDKILLVLGSISIAGFVSIVLDRRGRADPPQPDPHHIPEQLDLADLPDSGGNWLIVTFSSVECETCAGVVAQLLAMATPGLTTRVFTVERHADVHDRHLIDAVPTTVIADPLGKVRKSFLGPVDRQTLEAALDEAVDLSELGDL